MIAGGSGAHPRLGELLGLTRSPRRPIKQLLSQGSMRGRELLRGGVQIRPELASPVSRIADLTNLLDRVLVVIEQTFGKELSSPHGCCPGRSRELEQIRGH